MNIRELARMCQVSPATVSRYLNQPDMVSPETAEKLEAAICKTGYAPQRKSRRAPQGGMIAIVAPTLNHHFFQSAIELLERQLCAAGRESAVLFMPAGKEAVCLDMLRRLRPAGIVLLDGDIAEDAQKSLAALNVPIVMCGETSRNQRFSSVHVDDMAAAYGGVQYLFRLGHRRIGFISDPQTSISSGFQRVTGCKKAFEDAGAEWNPECVVCEGCTYESGYAGTRRLIARFPEITAIFAFSDEAAMGAMCALTDAGLTIPGDVSVLGFDDLPLSQRVRPQLTTIHQPLKAIVARSVEFLDRSETGGVGASVVVPFEITERQSCRALK